VRVVVRALVGARPPGHDALVQCRGSNMRRYLQRRGGVPDGSAPPRRVRAGDSEKVRGHTCRKFLYFRACRATVGGGEGYASRVRR